MEGKAQRQSFTTILIQVAIISVIGIGVLQSVYHNHQIGSFFEGSEYKDKFYVNLFPSDSASKNYRLVADIERSEGYYYIEKVYFPNGGYLTFDFERVYLNRKTYVEDDNGKEWEVILTDQHPAKQ